MIWNQLLARLSVLNIRRHRRHQQVLRLPTEVHEDVYGLPGDSPSDVSRVISSITCILNKIGVPCDIIEQDIEICVPLENLCQIQQAFSAEAEFCAPFRPARSYYNKHLAQYSRFKVKGMHQCFFLVPDSHYGLEPKAFADILHPPHLGFPLLPLPHYVNGLASVAVRPGIDNNNFVAQIEFLIDGMDINEEWCGIYLDDGLGQDFVRSRSSQSAKKARMGSNPKYEGNLTTYIHNVEERNSIINVTGRVMEVPPKIK